VAEGVKVIDAAVSAGAPVEALYYAPAVAAAPSAVLLIERAREAGIRVFALQPGVLERVADAVTPQPVVGVVGRVDHPLEETLRSCPPWAPIVVCVDVRDPGNLGSILRSADASGAAAVICCDGTADAYSPKTVRASAGSLFHVPVVMDVPVATVLDQLGAAGYERVGTRAHGGEDYATAQLGERVALVLGNEAQGLDAAVASRLDAFVSIPMAGSAESLNVAMAATVLCFELARRRRADAEPSGAPRATGAPGRVAAASSPSGGARAQQPLR
jgi:TrmH family RNA methyltransferase